MRRRFERLVAQAKSQRVVYESPVAAILAVKAIAVLLFDMGLRSRRAGIGHVWFDGRSYFCLLGCSGWL